MKATIQIHEFTFMSGFFAEIIIKCAGLVGNVLTTQSCVSKGMAKRIAIQVCGELNLDYKFLED